MTRLAFTFYLGSALIPVADGLATALAERLGSPVDFDRDASDDDRRAALDQPPPGVLWLCGLETVMRQDDGRLDASIVGAPIFPGRSAPVYDSVIVAREGWPGVGLADLGGATLAINQPDSWSGHHALRVHLHRRGLRESMFGRVVVSGSHEASIDALIAGAVDCAAIDETAWAARLARDPRVATLRAIDRTDPSPAPPFSIVGGLDGGLVAEIRNALPGVSVPGLEGIAPASDADYSVFRDGLAASRSLAWRSP
jgi:ABC-type phosphate/phosphonate transport system substrate-binding protein